MHEDVVAVCAPDLIQQYFPDAQKINDYSYDLSAEQLVQLLYYSKLPAEHLGRLVQAASDPASESFSGATT